jgi:hypothetical protein
MWDRRTYGSLLLLLDDVHRVPDQCPNTIREEPCAYKLGILVPTVRYFSSSTACSAYCSTCAQDRSCFVYAAQIAFLSNKPAFGPLIGAKIEAVGEWSEESDASKAFVQGTHAFLVQHGVEAIEKAPVRVATPSRALHCRCRRALHPQSSANRVDWVCHCIGYEPADCTSCKGDEFVFLSLPPLPYDCNWSLDPARPVRAPRSLW